MDRTAHWEKVYNTKAATDVSWYQPQLEKSLFLISSIGIVDGGQIIDVGGGASTLVDDSLRRGFKHVTVLDISSVAIENAKVRLGPLADQVTWLCTDITTSELTSKHYDIWHDRAAFHFLTSGEDRRRYIQTMRYALKPNGHLIVAAFAHDGPAKCSGLDVIRYSPDQLKNEFGDEFHLVQSLSEDHITPSGGIQRFVYCCFRRQMD
jgi:Methylase involved in ubiquinone/menaquinone biosynthesis